MHQKERMRKIFLLLWCFLFFFLIGCQGTRVVVEREPSPEPSPAYKKGGPPPWAPAHGFRAKHRYRYYSSSRVYYEKDRGIYFYYKDGEWQVSVSLPSSIRIDVNDYITVEMDTDKPYEFHTDIVKQYPGVKPKEKNKWKEKDKDKGKNKGKGKGKK